MTNIRYDKKDIIYLLVIIIAGFAVRFAAASFSDGFEIDVTDFKCWSDLIFQHGLSNFYSLDVFTDYPPGYMYVLYIIGGIKKTLELAFDSTSFTLLIKFPAMLCDVLTSVFIFYIGKTRLKQFTAWLICAAYLFNPAIIINSAIWGQVDSVYTIFLIISIFYLTEKKYCIAYVLFAIAILIKPQSLILSPVYIYSAFECINNGNKLKSAGKLLLYGLAALFTLFIGILPFVKGFNFMPIINLYKETLSSYPYATVNAYNLYAAIGANWADITKSFLFTDYNTFGIIVIDVIVILSIVLLLRNNSKSNYFFVAGLTNLLTFVFAVKMHERYIFPTLALLLIAYCFKRDRRILALYFGFSLTTYINCSDVLEMAKMNFSLEVLEHNIIPFSILNVIFAALLLLTAFFAYKGKNEEKESIQQDVYNFRKLPKLVKKDYLCCLVIMVVYGCIAFFNLGNTKSPQTIYSFSKDESFIADFGEVYEFDKMAYLQGIVHDQNFKLLFSIDGNVWDAGEEQTAKNVLSWQNVEFNMNARFIKITSLSDKLSFFEIAFLSDEKVITPTETDNALFDEQNLVPKRHDYMNSTYFDEIYYARTGYEFVHSLPVYEWTHPPLGKDIIALGIKLFGLTPFGWRFMGTLFGVLMIIPMYAFAKRMLKQSFWAVITTLIFTFDFMHFAQTRLTTIDTYITIFTLCMFYYMYLYINTDYMDSSFKEQMKYLGLSGLFMGLGIACKWPGIYAGCGLAIIFFISVYYRSNEYLSLKKEGCSYLPEYPNQLANTICLCVLFFVLIPAIIYGLSYIPFLKVPGQNGIATIIKNQTDMYGYHSNLVSTHPYESQWWSWPLNIRPIFYYVYNLEGNIKQGISSFGNPAVWWGGVVGIVYCFYRFLCKNDKTASFLIIAFLAQYLPWVLVPRTTYIYHYFPSVPFIVLMLVYFMKNELCRKSLKPAYIYVAVVIVLFVAFYPVLSGMPISVDYVKFLRWLPTWQLI